jgi:hypothetical protein
MLYMIVERFGDANAVYRRFQEQGRMTPDGLHYVSSWICEDLSQCFQLMETDDRRLLDEWTALWSDIVNFDIHPVISSVEASKRVSSPS